MEPPALARTTSPNFSELMSDPSNAQQMQEDLADELTRCAHSCRETGTDCHGQFEHPGLSMHSIIHFGSRHLHLQHQDVQLHCMFSAVLLCLLQSWGSVVNRHMYLSAF